MKITNAEVNQYAAKQPKLSVFGSRTRGVESLNVNQERAHRRRMQELLNENYKDAKIETPQVFIKGGFKTGKTTNSRRVLGSKKTLANAFDDDPTNTEVYLSMVSEPSKYPVRLRCVVCGYFSNSKCLKCGSHTCSLKCDKLHKDRCD